MINVLTIGRTVMIDLARQLKSLREESHYTQDYVANYLNISRSTYANYERNHSFPDYDKLISICNLYHVSSDYVLGLSDKKNQYSGLRHKKDINLLNYYHRLGVENQDYVIGIMISLYKKETSDEIKNVF